MQFTTHKRRHPPSIIIVSLIDILIVMLIFLVATTTVKQQPAIKLALPQSQQAKPGAKENSVQITVAKTEPFFYLGPTAIVPERLLAELTDKAKKNPEIQLSIRADKEAPFGQIVKVMDMAKSAKIKNVNAFTSPAGGK
jgi:biopolymer transport protein ExbD